MIKNKKAEEGNFLGEHTLNIIIGVLCLILLLFLGYIVYNLFTKTDDLRIAQNNLKSFVGDYQAFYDNKDLKTKDFLLYGPNEWYLVVYLKGNINLPKEIFETNKDLACICESNEVEDCVNKNTGICMPLERNWIYNNKTEYSYYLEGNPPYKISLTKPEVIK